MRVQSSSVATLLLTAAVWAAPGEAATHVLTISQMSFGEMPRDVVVGDSIEWRNADPVPHTATAVDAGFDLLLEPEARGTVVVERAGTFEVVCTYHPGMRVELMVK